MPYDPFDPGAEDQPDQPSVSGYAPPPPSYTPPPPPELHPGVSPSASALADPGFNQHAARMAQQLADAQQDGNSRAKWMAIATAFSQAAQVLTGGRPDTAGGLAQVEAVRQLPVQQLQQQQAMEHQGMQTALEQQKLSQEMRAQDIKRQDADANSPRSKALQAQLHAAGVEFTGSVDEWEKVHQGIQTAETAKEHGLTEKARADALAHQKDVDAENRTQQGITNKHAADELAVAQAHLRVAQDAAKLKGAAGKPIPDQERAHIMAAIGGIDSIANLRQMQGEVGISAPTPFGAGGRYSEAVKAEAPQIGAAITNMGQRQPVPAQVEGMLPSGWRSKGQAAVPFDVMTRNAEQNVRSRLAALKAGGFNPDEIAQMEQQLNAKLAGSGATAPGGGAKMVIPPGANMAPRLVPAADVEAALAAGGRLVE